MDYAIAKSRANDIVRDFSPACIRIEIAGSIRRKKLDEIKDVEIVCIPKPVAPVFGQKAERPIEALISELRSRGDIRPRLDKLGRVAMGLKYKRLIWNETPLDLFIVTPDTWGVIFALRTGDSDFSRLLVTPRAMGGALPDGAYVAEGRLYFMGCRNTPEEADFFREIGLDYIEPHRRTLAAIKLAIFDKE